MKHEHGLIRISQKDQSYIQRTLCSNCILDTVRNNAHNQISHSVRRQIRSGLSIEEQILTQYWYRIEEPLIERLYGT